MSSGGKRTPVQSGSGRKTWHGLSSMWAASTISVLRTACPPARPQIVAFWRSLQLRDLVLAHACALGHEAVWERFMFLYREPLTQAAIAITGSAAMGHELADSLYAEMFGLTERDGERRSPLSCYSGRGSFKGFLRASLARSALCRPPPPHRARNGAPRRRTRGARCFTGAFAGIAVAPEELSGRHSRRARSRGSLSAFGLVCGSQHPTRNLAHAPRV
jgi:RNA polymerase sigma-70 factor (ECF subfamily)